MDEEEEEVVVHEEDEVVAPVSVDVALTRKRQRKVLAIATAIATVMRTGTRTRIIVITPVTTVIRKGTFLFTVHSTQTRKSVATATSSVTQQVSAAVANPKVTV